MRRGCCFAFALALLAGLVASGPEGSLHAASLRRGKAERRADGKGDRAGAPRAKPTRGGLRRGLGALSLSRRQKPAKAAPAVGPKPAPRKLAPRARGPIAKSASSLAGKIRAGLARVPRAVKIAAAALVVGGALASVWVIPASLLVKAGMMAAVVGITAVGALYTRARGKIAGWKRSPSYQAIAAIEQAAANGDAERLGQLGDAQEERARSLEREIATARKNGADQLADGTPVKDAARELDFIGLAVARSALHESTASQNASQRLGQRTVDAWSKGIAELDDAAQSSDFEGNLALELKALGGELDRESRAADDLDGVVKAYASHVPRLFGGDMKRDQRATTGLLERFRTEEIGRERTLLDRTNSAMRGRVTKRLVARGGTFATRHDRLVRLSALEEVTGQAAALAEEIDSELASAISHRESEQTNLLIAATKTAVPVTKTRTGSDGKIETYTDIEDQSAIWRGLAASDASAAQAASRNARDGIARLGPLVESLRGNATLRGEKLVTELPTTTARRVDEGNGGLMTFVGPPLFNLLTGDGSNVRQVRDSFRSDLVSLQRVHKETGARRQVERNWVDTQVTQDLDRQMAEAGRR